MFFMRTLATFFARTCPASSSEKPSCMKKIRNETTSTQTVFTPWATAAMSLMRPPLG